MSKRLLAMLCWLAFCPVGAAELEWVIPPGMATCPIDHPDACNDEECESYGEKRCVELGHCRIGETEDVDTVYIAQGTCSVTCCDGYMIMSLDTSCDQVTGKCREIVRDPKGNVVLPGGLVLTGESVRD